jgi:hypothetical protein
LRAALRAEDLVKTTAHITLREDIGEYVKVRVKCLSDLRSARMLMIVGGFIKQEYLNEVDAIAADE